MEGKGKRNSFCISPKELFQPLKVGIGRNRAPIPEPGKEKKGAHSLRRSLLKTGPRKK